jgi:hypothetical protein
MTIVLTVLLLGCHTVPPQTIKHIRAKRPSKPKLEAIQVRALYEMDAPTPITGPISPTHVAALVFEGEEVQKWIRNEIKIRNYIHALESADVWE